MNTIKNYSAIFEKYNDALEVPMENVKIHFKNVKDDLGNIIKPKWVIKIIDNQLILQDILCKLLPEQEVYFTAQILENSDLPDGFGLVDITFSLDKI